MKTHWEAAKWVVRYLKTTQDFELTYNATNDAMISYSDADHVSQLHRHSISDYMFLLGGGAVMWSSKKQPIIALSMTKAEYIVATHATKVAMWLHTFIGEITASPAAITTIYCDNQAAIALSKNRQYHARTKHIDIWFHFIRESVEQGMISLTYFPTGTMTADLLTKALNCSKTEEHAVGLGLLSA